MEKFIIAFILIILTLAILAVVIYVHYSLIRMSFRYYWFANTINYPLTYLFYKRKLRYLTDEEINMTINNMAKEPTTWFSMRLLQLCYKELYKRT